MIQGAPPGYASLPARRLGERRDLGTRRFQRAGSAKDVLIGIRRHEVTPLALIAYCLRTCATGSKRAAGLPSLYIPILRAGSGAYLAYHTGVTRRRALLHRQSSGFSHSPALTGLFSM